MTTTITKTIGSAAGRDYATISGWLAYLVSRGDITAATGVDELHIGVAYPDSVFSESATVQIPPSGVTAGPSNTCTLKAATTIGSTAALTYNESNGVALRLTGAANFFPSAYGIVQGLQIQFVGTGSYTGTAANSQAIGCVIDTGTASTIATAFLSQSLNSNQSFRNNVVLIRNVANRYAMSMTTAATGVCEGNTFLNVIGSTGSPIQSTTSARPSPTKNNLFLGWPTSVNLANNSFTDANLVNNGTNGTINSTFSATNLGSRVTNTEINSITAGSIDAKLKAGSTVKAAGTPSSTNLTDIFGTTRSTSTPSIGAFEYATAAPPPVPSGPFRFPGLLLGVLNQ